MPESWMSSAIFFVLPAIFVLLGCYALARGVVRFFQRKPVRGTLRMTTGLVLLLGGLLVGSVGLNLRTYHRLTHEQELCQVWFSAIGKQDFAAEIRYPDGSFRTVQLRGDTWQLDARVLKWKGYATVIGLDPRYRLERISGRYADIDQEREQKHSAFELSRPSSVNVMRVLEKHPNWTPWVDATYGSATYLPMADGAGYAVALGNSGLVARPVNDAAKSAVADWP